MPTMPDPSSPFMDSRVASEFDHIPGLPSSAGKPGLQAGDVSFPAPPALNSAPVGRPPEVTPPTPMGAMPQAPPAAGQAPPGQPAKPTGGTQPTQAGAGVTPQGQPAALLPGTLSTPSADPRTGVIRETLTPEGQESYRQAVLKVRESLGGVPSVFKHPNLPEMEVVPGQWNYNPFTGKWSK
jgi:hypothetical protein